jgi:hypothetical protein
MLNDLPDNFAIAIVKKEEPEYETFMKFIKWTNNDIVNRHRWDGDAGKLSCYYITKRNNKFITDGCTSTVDHNFKILTPTEWESLLNKSESKEDFMLMDIIQMN